MSSVPEKDFSEGLHLDVPKSPEQPWRCLRKLLRIWTPSSFLFHYPQPVVFMLIEKKMVNPPADTLATFQAGRKEIKRKEKRRTPVESAPLYSGEEQLSSNPTDVCLHLVVFEPHPCLPASRCPDPCNLATSRICNWEHCCPGQNQGSLRKRMLGGCWSLPPFPWLLPPDSIIC